MSKTLCILKTAGTLWAWIILTIAYVAEIAALGILVMLFFENTISYIIGSAIFIIFFLAYVFALENRHYSNKYKRWWKQMCTFFKCSGIFISTFVTMITIVFLVCYLIDNSGIGDYIAIGTLILSAIAITVGYAYDQCY